MALSKPWYSDANYAAPDVTSSARVGASLIWSLKSFLKGTIGTVDARGLWTVAGSSDAVTAAMDGVDRWGNTFDASKLTYADSTGTRSWIVMQSPAAMGPQYLLIDYSGGADSGGGTCLRAFASSAPFTGGSVSARPTSTKEFQVSSTSSDRTQMNDGSVANHGFHYSCDASGSFWFLSSRSGIGIHHFMIALQKTSETHPGDTGIIGLCGGKFEGRGPGEQNGQGFWGNGGGSQNGRISGRSPADTISFLSPSLQLNIPVDASTQGWNAPNAADSTWDIFPIYVTSTIGGYLGSRGRLPDCGWAYQTMSPGSAQLNAGQTERIVAGNLIIPFTVPVSF